MKKIAKSLLRKTSKGIEAISRSLKFEELLYKEHKINSHNRVFVNERNVNGKKEKFEKMLDVFLVK